MPADELPESRALLAESRNLQAYFARHFRRRSVEAAIPESMPERFVQVFAQVA